MGLLEELILIMSKEEIQAYKLYTNRKNSFKERKDILLFDAIKKEGSSFKEDLIALNMYGPGSKNPFYRLKNRLTNNIFKSLSVHHFDNEVNHIYHLLGLANLFNKKRSFNLVLNCLKKAEEKALKFEYYELLEVIYSDFIKVSQELLDVNPQLYIDKRLINSKRLEKLRTLENAISILNYKLRKTQNFTSEKFDIIPYLEDVVSQLVDDKTLLTLKFRTKVYRAVSQILLSKQDFKSLEVYLIDVYKQFSEENLFSESNHDTKLQMLTYLVNTLFKNKKIKDSLNWIKSLNESINEYNGKLKAKYQIYYYNALVNNYNVIDKDKSIAILEEIKNSDWMKSDSYFGIFVYVNLALNWFDKFNYKASLKNFQALKIQDQYKNTSESLRFKWAIGELIVRYSSNNIAAFKMKLKEFKLEYSELLNLVENKRDLKFIKILEGLGKNQKTIYNLKDEINSFCSVEGSDEELIDYKSWLKSVN